MIVGIAVVVVDIAVVVVVDIAVVAGVVAALDVAAVDLG
jgi:hypothetical protein